MLINPDESIHAQAQDNNNQNAGEDAIQHIAIFDAIHSPTTAPLMLYVAETLRPDKSAGIAAGILTNR